LKEWTKKKNNFGPMTNLNKKKSYQPNVVLQFPSLCGVLPHENKECYFVGFLKPPQIIKSNQW